MIGFSASFLFIKNRIFIGESTVFKNQLHILLKKKKIITNLNFK